jgi:hypothetical protein
MGQVSGLKVSGWKISGWKISGLSAVALAKAGGKIRQDLTNVFKKISTVGVGYPMPDFSDSGEKKYV